MSNETKIGILALVAIGISLWGYKFIMGSNMFSSSMTLVTEYEDIEQLSKSNPVFLNGKQIGVVSDLYFEPSKLQSVIVEMEITEDLPIPKSAKAQLMSTGLVGGKGVELLFAGPCSGANCAEDGDKLEGVLKGFLETY
ncbi:MAG: MlaD family protein, partial [Saprospiraceae bacterium]